MQALATVPGASVYHCDWRALLDVVPTCNALIVDAPYSERVHAGHDAGVCDDMRRSLDYAAWSAKDVSEFVSAWSPRVSGWMASITDHALAREWESAMAAAGRYVFTPLPFYAPGSRIRLAGDGPSNWTTWIVVARPRTKQMAAWGTLPGGYALPKGHAESMVVVGGKPLWLMERLVEDYTRPGDLVVDPCCGAGTTLVAALRTGRRAIGGDVLREHAEIAARRVMQPQQQPLFGGAA